MEATPMFPLGSVLVPGMVLPLHVFEPRYRALARDVTSGPGEFGVTLIERGSEVGGGDVRTDVGTMARVLEHEELEDGRWALVAVGVRRIRVLGWLDDDPYPRAVVEDWPDEDDRSAADLAGEYAAAVADLRRVLALAGEVGEGAAPATLELVDDPCEGSFHLAAVAPVGPLDRQAILCAPGPAARVAVARRVIAEAAELLAARLDRPDP